MLIFSFPPLIMPNCRVLILGSMPGKASLDADQYYAHSRNYFWLFMQKLFDISLQLDYQQRCELLTQQGVGVWDVLESCQRSSSLDSDIQTDSIVANDFATLFITYPNINTLFFNGQKAAQCYQRYVQRNLPESIRDKVQLVLPSTSPANASISYKDKLVSWSQIKDHV